MQDRHGPDNFHPGVAREPIWFRRLGEGEPPTEGKKKKKKGWT